MNKGDKNPHETIAVASDLVMAKLKQKYLDKPPALLSIGHDSEKTILCLRPGIMTLGRDPLNDIVIEVHTISREHLRLTISDDLEMVELEDLASRNGTFLNEKRINAPVILQKDDIITTGNLVFKFLPKGSPDHYLYEQLQFEANTDKLTQCFNKHYFFDVLNREVMKQKANVSALSLIMFDIDHFKQVNDQYGHDAGDYVLKELANLIWHREIREIDLFARYGGEEFVVLLFRSGSEHALKVAERIRSAVAQHRFIYDKQAISVTVSLGIAEYYPGIQSALELFKRADHALYESKRHGRNRVTVDPNCDGLHNH
mgnify:CR=1 FL=1